MFDFEIAFYLYKISRILEIFENNKYKSKAFYNAGMAIDAYGIYTQNLIVNGDIRSIEGIGESSAKLIKEVLMTGECAELNRLEKIYNISDYSLILTHGLKTRLIKKLFDKEIKNIKTLRANLNSDILPQRGFDSREIKEITEFLAAYSKSEGKFLRPYIKCLGKELVDFLNADYHTPIANLTLTEWEDKPFEINICCVKSEKLNIFNKLNSSNRYNNVYIDENHLSCITNFGVPVIVSFVNKVSSIKDPEGFLLGDLHMHTKWSDGKHSIEEMVEEGRRLGRKYIGITDHSYSLKIARGISEVDALQQIEEISALKVKGIKILSGIEVEVLKDGTLDFSDAILSKFDYVIAGVHTFLQQSSSEMRARLEKALSNPYVNIFAHPTGKLLGRPGVLFSDRESIDLSFNEILEICKKNNVVMEINCFPERFDVGVEHFKEIYDSGVHISVGSDSHSAAHMNCISYAEEMLNQFPELKSRTLNTFEYEELINFFENQRQKISGNYANSVKLKRDFNYFFNNNQEITTGQIAVIGIDLTGSEGKPSGWAVLSGDHAITKPICSDDELIEESLKFNPKVISIDSPLSYPEGRHCTDPNCECKKFGITRYCERLLSSFGIGVYPCLIPSMVNLTNRGIRLAKKFRDRGIEVIESYPGVAQDILNIRRKQNGVEHLKNSYKNFGIKGEYLTAEKITHDELDAIASALVGLFYVDNQYVGLGNDKENYLIVPSVANKFKDPLVIGLTGEIGAGKTTLAEYLKFKHGFKTLRYSKIIQDLYHCDGKRDTLQQVGQEIASNPDRQKGLSLEAIRQINNNPNSNFVIDGLRHLLDYETLLDHFGERFILIYIDSPFTTTYKRYNKRNNLDLTKDEFKQIINNKSEEDIIHLKGICYTSNMILENNKTFKDFFENFEIKFREYLCH